MHTPLHAHTYKHVHTQIHTCSLAVPTTSGAHAHPQPPKPQPGRRAPVWADPADAEVAVNLASKARLRKLRASHDQQEVDGECIGLSYLGCKVH
eukprot:scaffold67108_cov16-Tisochrysis_lutea.AAC.1